MSFDSTSISTYSTTITDAAWRLAKQNPELRQVSYIVVCDHASGDVVFAYTYDGSINDKAILPTIYLQMQSANLALKDNILVTDRGFQSIYNTQKVINLKLKYIQFLNLNEGAVRAQLRRNAKALRDPIAHSNPRMGICGIHVADHRTEQTEDGYQLQLAAHCIFTVVPLLLRRKPMTFIAMYSMLSITRTKKYSGNVIKKSL